MTKYRLISISSFMLIFLWVSGSAFAQLLPAPQLQSPSNGATDLPTTLTLQWQSVIGGLTYRVQVTTNSNFSSGIIVDATNVLSTSRQVSGLSEGTTYYWRVRALDELGAGSWSAVWSFTTEETDPSPPDRPPPPAPTLTSPSNGAAGVTVNPTLYWNPANDAETYRIQVSSDSGFESLIADESGLTGTEFQISGLDYQTTYYWRVRSSNDDGSSNWSEVWNFTTEEDPADPPPVSSPVLDTPADGATDQPVNLILVWNPVNGAEWYHIQIADVQNFSSPVIDREEITSTSFDAEGLDYNTTYYWRVRAFNDGVSGWSETRQFTTREEPLVAPGTPDLVSPQNGAAGQPTTITFNWSEVLLADSYHLQVAEDRNLNNLIVNRGGISGTTETVEGFDYETTYHWRVRAANAAGNSDWSEVWRFTTVSPEDPTISIHSPRERNIWNGLNTHTITWSMNGNIENISLEYSADGGNTWSFIDEGTDAATGSFEWTVPDTSSNRSRIKITDVEDSDIYAVSESFVVYPVNINLQHLYTFNSARSSSDYRLIGLPADSRIPLDDIFSGTPGEDWNAYFDNGAVANYMVPYDSTDVFTFQAGRAFWAISKSDIQISETTNSVDLSPDTTYSFPVHEGWNIIANPFDIEIPWSSVQSKNELNDPIWAFDGTFSEASSFDTYQGYYFYNRDGLEELVIPYHSDTAASPDQHMKSTEERQIITLKLLHNNIPQSSIEAGIRSYSTDGSGLEYDFAPPGNFQDYRITIRADEIASGYPHLARLFSEPSAEPHTFKLSIKSPEGEPLHIQAEGLHMFTAYDVLLVDKHMSKTYDLHQNPDLRINSTEEIDEFTLVIGGRESISDYMNQESPVQTALFQNYPNPFNNQTVIEYSVGQNMANSQVVLEIFNVVGQRITMLVDERQPAGSYQVQWNTGNNPGQNLASGLYFYRLQVGDVVKTRRLTLIK